MAPQSTLHTAYDAPLKCRIDHKPVRRGRQMIDLLVVGDPKPSPANSYDTAIRVVSYEAAIDQLFKRMRSSSSALTQQAVSPPRT